MTNILIGIIIGIIVGLLVYRYFLDKPDVVNKINKMKNRGQGNTQNVDFDSEPKQFATIDSSMSYRDVRKLLKSLKKL